MTANLIAFNAVLGRTSSGSVEFQGDPNDVIQLTIGGNRYTFDSLGIMKHADVVPTCINLNSHGSCARIVEGTTCVPTCEPKYKSED